MINLKSNDVANVIRFVEYLGFKNLNEYQEFINQQDSYKNILLEKFDFSELSYNQKLILQNDIGVFVDNKYEIKKNNSKSIFVDAGPDCAARRLNCNNGSLAVYTLEIIGCGATAAAVAGGTLGLGGIAVYTICSSASLVHYNSMLNDCTYAYEDCLDKPKQVD